MAETSPAMQQLASLIASAWTDEKLKRRLMSDPMAVLKEYGIPPPPPGVELKVVENTDHVTYFVLPPKPAGEVHELSADQLQSVAGGWTCCLVCGGGGGGAFAEYPPWYVPPTPMRLP